MRQWIVLTAFVVLLAATPMLGNHIPLSDLVQQALEGPVPKTHSLVRIPFSTKATLLEGSDPTGMVAQLARVSAAVSSRGIDQEAQLVSLSTGMINVKEFGAVGNNVVDDTPALQATIDAAPSGGIIYLPPGTYKVTSSVTFGGKQVRMMGANAALNGTRLEGTVDGPIIQNSPGTGTGKGTSFEHLHIVNWHGSGIGIQYTDFIGGSIRNVEINAHRAIVIHANTFTVLVDQAVVRGLPGAPMGSVGILAGGHAQILSSDIVGFDHGIRASGTTVNITGCRIEVNRTGIVAGMDINGGTWLLARSVIAGNSFEANATAIGVWSAQNVVFEGIGIQGSDQGPGGGSQLGLDVGASVDVLFQSVSVFGEFAQAAIRVQGEHFRTRFSQVAASNNLAGKKVWNVQVPLSNLEFHQTNYALRADGATTPVLQERLVARSLSAVDQLDGVVLGKNLRGKAVPVRAGATSKVVTFATQVRAGDAAISAAVPVQGGGALAPGTYFYIATLVNEAGETGAVGEKSVAVTPPNNQVNLSLYGSSGPRAKRRIYRGTASGAYDGYFETDFNASSFTDAGGPFTGMKSPMGPGFDAETSMQEPDANYAVIVTPAWNTTVWVTDKATTGFTVHFGTSPSSDSSFDWFIVR
jgi:hypothetical protein